MIPYGFTRQADRELRKLPGADQKRIIKKIKEYLADSEPLRYAKKVEGVRGKVYRFRVGDYRVIFDWLANGILVTRVGARRDVYR